MNATHLNLYQVCRLCLSELNGSSFVPIFDNKDSNLPQKIKSCFAISVEETDRLPNVLCPACTRDVERFYKFKEKVLKNNAFLRSYVFQRDRKAAQFLSAHNETNSVASPSLPMKMSKRAVSIKNKRNPSKNKSGTIQDQSNSLGSLNNYECCELSNTFFDNSNKVKVEIIPQVDNDMYSSSSSVYSEIKNNIVEMRPSPSTEESSTGFRTIKSMGDARAISSISDNSSSKSLDYTSVIRHSSNDYRDVTSSYDKYISVHVKEEVCKSEGIAEEYDSEDTKSAVSLTFKEEDEDKLIIDEETMEVKQFVNICGGNQSVIGEDGRTSDSCILLRTLISASNENQLTQSNLSLKNTNSNRQNARKPATFFPQVLMNEMSSYSPPSPSSPRSGDNLNLAKSNTRRKQKCPTKSANEQSIDAADETDEEVAEVANLTQHSQEHPIVYHQEVVNISPVTVTCSSNGREEIVGYNQAQFLDEVLSRHSSPATTPPMVVPSQAERLHKACDVLLRAASKIQDLPPGIQQEEVVVEEEVLFSNCSQLNDGQNEQITIRHNPVPLYEINFSSVNALNEANRSTKKVKSREKVQSMSTHKECSNCHAVQTTIWRRDRFGNIVCNACGLYYKLHNYDRPGRMRRDEIHKRNRKRNSNDNKAKKIKRSLGENYELDSSKEQENSSGSYTPPTNFNEQTSHVSMSDLNQSLNVSSSGIKKNHWISAAGTNSLSIKEEIEEEDEGNGQLFDEEDQIHEAIQPHMENVEEISINGSEDVETLNNHEFNDQEEDKLSVSAFQLSTHFVPINGKVYEDSYSNENSMSETPLNLAAGN